LIASIKCPSIYHTLILLHIYFSVLSGDYTTCMTYLMRYPGAVDITYIIDYALYLRDEQVDKTLHEKLKFIQAVLLNASNVSHDSFEY